MSRSTAQSIARVAKWKYTICGSGYEERKQSRDRIKIGWVACGPGITTALGRCFARCADRSSEGLGIRRSVAGDGGLWGRNLRKTSQKMT